MNGSQWRWLTPCLALCVGLVSPSLTQAQVPPPGTPPHEASRPAKAAHEDRKELQKDRKELQKDRKELHEDRKELHEDRKELREDRKELREDKAEAADSSPEKQAERAARHQRRMEQLKQLRAKYGAEAIARPPIRDELRRHAWNLARLTRLAALAEQQKKTRHLKRIGDLRVKEEARHQRRMAELTAGAAQPAAPQPASPAHAAPVTPGAKP